MMELHSTISNAQQDTVKLIYQRIVLMQSQEGIHVYWRGLIRTCFLELENCI